MAKPFYHNEATLQAQIITFIKYNFPAARYCASLGGQYQQYNSQKRKATKTGYVKGFPDLQITEARGGYFGLFIELKYDKTRYASKEQKDWINDLQIRGYRAEICKGYEETIDLITEYLTLEKTINTKC